MSELLDIPHMNSPEPSSDRLGLDIPISHQLLYDEANEVQLDAEQTHGEIAAQLEARQAETSSLLGQVAVEEEELSTHLDALESLHEGLLADQKETAKLANTGIANILNALNDVEENFPGAIVEHPVLNPENYPHIRPEAKYIDLHANPFGESEVIIDALQEAGILVRQENVYGGESFGSDGHSEFTVSSCETVFVDTATGTEVQFTYDPHDEAYKAHVTVGSIDNNIHLASRPMSDTIVHGYDGTRNRDSYGDDAAQPHRRRFIAEQKRADTDAQKIRDPFDPIGLDRTLLANIASKLRAPVVDTWRLQVRDESIEHKSTSAQRNREFYAIHPARGRRGSPRFN